MDFLGIKIEKLEYIIEGARRNKIRKQRRLEKFIENRERKKKLMCTCGEDPYCYCGDGTPYSY